MSRIRAILSVLRHGPAIRRAGPLAAAVAGAAVLTAACSSGPGSIAVAGATPAASSAAAQGGPLAFATCMRTHGEPNFPDPNSDGGFSITPASGIDMNSTTYLNARKTCSSLLHGGTSGNSVSPQLLAKEIKFAQCMRTHGIPDFPDPNSDGGFSGQSSINPQSPTFQNAQSTCSAAAGLSGGGSSS
jgi:hypothetical protein